MFEKREYILFEEALDFLDISSKELKNYLKDSTIRFFQKDPYYKKIYYVNKSDVIAISGYMNLKSVLDLGMTYSSLCMLVNNGKIKTKVIDDELFCLKKDVINLDKYEIPKDTTTVDVDNRYPPSYGYNHVYTIPDKKVNNVLNNYTGYNMYSQRLFLRGIG
jgi:hypothetical protein